MARTAPRIAPSDRQARPTIRRFIVEGILREMTRIEPRCRPLLARQNPLAGEPGGLYANVALQDYVAFLETAARVLDRPDLGLDLGWNFQMWEVGPVYHLLATARTLREALGVYQRFQGIWQTQTSLTAEPAGDDAVRFDYRIDDARIWPRRHDAEFFVASFCAMVRELIGPRWTPLGLCFEHDTGGRLPALAGRFRCRVRDLAEANSILIAKCDLDRALTGRAGVSDAALAVVEKHLFELLEPAQDTLARPLPERLGEAIARRMGHDTVALDVMAAQLGHTPRTLRRRLAALNTSFGAILAHERLLKAENLLASGEVRLEEVALRLGYTSHAAFSRAYRDWTGRPPRAARQDIARKGEGG